MDRNLMAKPENLASAAPQFMNTAINIDHWLETLYSQAQSTHNQPILRGFDLYDLAWECRETHPQQALAYWTEAQQLAEAAGNPYLALYYQYWCCEAYVSYLDNYRAALDIAIRMIVQARKYPECPILGKVYHKVIHVYRRIDPVGYADKVNEMLRYVEQHVLLDYSSRTQMIWHAADVAFSLDETEQGIHLAQQYLAACQAHPVHSSREHMTTGALLIWAAIHYQYDQWEKVADYAASAEQYARRSQRQEALLNSLNWQALAAYHEGDTLRGDRFFAAAQFQATQLAPRYSHVYNVLWQLHQYRGEYSLIEPLFQQAITEMARGGEIYGECVARLTYCCWLGQRGQPMQTALAQARASAQQLRQPASYLAKLKRVEQGDFDPRVIW